MKENTLALPGSPAPRRTTNSPRVLQSIALAAAFSALGCAAERPSPEAPAAGFDSQACAEEALRQRPDPALVVEAARTSSQCAAGTPWACSVLGVLAELGLGMRPDRARAGALYRRACEAGNPRGCGNLGELLLADTERGSQPDGALALLQVACDAGHARPCATLGRTYAKGALVPREPALAARFLERACARGDGFACLDLADLSQNSAGSHLLRTDDLVEKACRQGNDAACTRLSRPPPVLLGTREP